MGTSVCLLNSSTGLLFVDVLVEFSWINYIHVHFKVSKEPHACITASVLHVFFYLSVAYSRTSHKQPTKM